MTGMVVSAVIDVDPADAADDVPVSVQPAPSPSARTEDFPALIFSGERTTGSRVCQPGQDGRTHKAGRHPGDGRRLNAQETMRAIQKTVIARDMRQTPRKRSVGSYQDVPGRRETLRMWDTVPENEKKRAKMATVSLRDETEGTADLTAEDTPDCSARPCSPSPRSKAFKQQADVMCVYRTWKRSRTGFTGTYVC